MNGGQAPLTIDRALSDTADSDGAGPTVEIAPTAIPLLAPRNGPVTPVTDPIALSRLAQAMGGSTSPIALDAERASGFRYSSRAYVVQLKRADIGNVLLDPIALGDLTCLQAPLAAAEWVLHAASQDLPCLAEAGLRPTTLFDTELAGRLAGLPRVGLGPLVEQMLGLHLEKGHGAADWSIRPLPANWLNYAALDVEVLIELRDAMEAELTRQDKLEWAHQEFAAIVAAPQAAPRIDPWRRTSGIHKIRDRRSLEIVRQLWLGRDDTARRRDIAPHRILPDTAIAAAAAAKPASVAALIALPVFAGRVQRRQADRWMQAIDLAFRTPEVDLPPVQLVLDGPPPANRWKDKHPEAAARLAVAREALAALSEEVSTPVENLLSPELVRRVCWAGINSAPEIEQILTDAYARPWQIQLTASLLAKANAATA
ncbi:ribonuclease D [Nakamurella antarctica]|uniref:Ribonuclease D n=1 Tax=Nakamurella antarctica TaxID=1902245 RepID=A0A3G8ZRH9_9ACTN|nr:ribonuclease D [Nakamurella antarctica]